MSEPCMSCGEDRREPAPERCLHKANHLAPKPACGCLCHLKPNVKHIAPCCEDVPFDDSGLGDRLSDFHAEIVPPTDTWDSEGGSVRDS